MKPTLQFTEKSHSDLGDFATRRGSNLPKTDYNFQTSANTNGGRCFVPPKPSFLTISRGFENEARRNFASEAALFVVMVAIVAPAIFVSLSTLVRSLGSL
jgi:hypothetical protein